jgi:hypothetical protein
MYHDGIGAMQLQVAKGTSPADLSNINQGALSMAYPIAKTLAIKDACDHFGKLFGCDLNRRDTMPFTIDKDILELKEELIQLFEIKKESLPLNEQDHFDRIIKMNEEKSYKKSIDYLSKL